MIMHDYSRLSAKEVRVEVEPDLGRTWSVHLIHTAVEQKRGTKIEFGYIIKNSRWLPILPQASICSVQGLPRWVTAPLEPLCQAADPLKKVVSPTVHCVLLARSGRPPAQ